MIPAEAVEAAARVLKDSLEAGYVEGEDLTDLLIDVQGFDLLAAMKVALEAAAPYMLAGAWKAGFWKGTEWVSSAGEDGSEDARFNNPHDGSTP